MFRPLTSHKVMNSVATLKQKITQQQQQQSGHDAQDLPRTRVLHACIACSSCHRRDAFTATGMPITPRQTDIHHSLLYAPSPSSTSTTDLCSIFPDNKCLSTLRLKPTVAHQVLCPAFGPAASVATDCGGQRDTLKVRSHPPRFHLHDFLTFDVSNEIYFLPRLSLHTKCWILRLFPEHS
jgi:hypothetical protein